MQRILVVLRGPIDPVAVRRRCKVEVSGPYELAVCRVLPAEHDGVHDGIHAQREVTAVLRMAMGHEAEAIAVLVASDRQADGVEVCAREWGATLVYA